MDQHGFATVTSWLNHLVDEHPVTPQGRSVVRSLDANPRLASYGSIREVAQAASVSIGTVTRTAQALGFAGWPALQEELRAIYLGSLSATEVAAHRQGTQSSASYASLARDRDNLNMLIRTVDLEQLKRIARRIAEARRTFIVATGSFNGLGQIFAHQAWLYGYDVRLLTEEAQVVNTIAHLEQDDLVIVISFWRIYESAYQTIQARFEAGSPAIFISETIPRELEERCSECVRVPTESVGFSPSLTSTTAVIHGIAAELADMDPERTNRLLAHAETEWERFKLMHRHSG